MARGDSMAGLLSDIWKCLGLSRLQSVSLCLAGGPQPELWVVRLVGVSSKLTQRWRLVCRNLLGSALGVMTCGREGNGAGLGRRETGLRCRLTKGSSNF